jgi:hypothetical protein
MLKRVFLWIKNNICYIDIYIAKRMDTSIDTLQMEQTGQGVTDMFKTVSEFLGFDKKDKKIDTTGIPTELPASLSPPPQQIPEVPRSPSPVQNVVQDFIDVANPENLETIKSKLAKFFATNKEQAIKLANHISRDGHNVATRLMTSASKVKDALIDFLKGQGVNLSTPTQEVVTATATEAPALPTLSVNVDKLTTISQPPEMTESFLTRATKKIKHAVGLSGGDPLDNQSDDLNTEELAQQILGGSKHTSGSTRKSGVRHMTRYFDYSVSEGGARKKDLGRETDKIHEEIIEEIKKLMDVDENTARIYKSVIYYKVKNEKPELSGYERAQEMKKLVQKEILDEIDIKAEKKKRDDWKSENESKAPASEKKEKKEPKEKKEKKTEKKEKKTKKSKKSEESLSESSLGVDL